ncbi:hypothetical protein H7K19_04315 [Mycolicibacterium neworleansense]|uniref:Transmembrane protein n=2 Tax=Mycolicibacterium neworleansense TaxID=146018 RepID=A0A0H5SA52_9MYCO|nr:hypothetical protein [Mycolicibacterium neworleansense]CRZ18224.1 hypothetical protein BN2156_05125 [Mycolicibacterium neworleansense]
MRVLQFIWRGVLAFDRIGSRIPQLIQIWLVEFFFALPLAFFVAKVVDIRGGFGVPGTGGSVPGVFWGGLAVSLVCGFFFVRNLIRPRLVSGSWTPMVHADVGDYTVMAGNRAWKVDYRYLTSHPSYALLLTLTAPVPAVMVLATVNHGDATFYWRVAGIAGLVILALMALARVLAWYVFRFGRSALATEVEGMSSRRLSWEIAWKPVLMLMVLMYAIVGIPLGWMWWQEKRTIAGLPEVTVADGVDAAGQYRRVRGSVIGEPVYWAPRGTGRGGNNYSGAGVLVELPSGGQALLLAESLSVPDFVGALKRVDDGHLAAQGKVVDHLTEDQLTYYGLDENAFPAAPAEGRVMVLLSYP